MCVEIIRTCGKCGWYKHFYWANCKDFQTRLEEACTAGTTPPKQVDCPLTTSEGEQSGYRPLSAWECQNNECPWAEWRNAPCPDGDMRRMLREQETADMDKLLAEKDEKDKAAFAEKYFKKVPVPPLATSEEEAGSSAGGDKTLVQGDKK